MKAKVIKPTFVSGEPLKKGDVVNLNQPVFEQLKAQKMVVEASEAEKKKYAAAKAEAEKKAAAEAAAAEKKAAADAKKK